MVKGAFGFNQVNTECYACVVEIKLKIKQVRNVKLKQIKVGLNPYQAMMISLTLQVCLIVISKAIISIN